MNHPFFALVLAVVALVVATPPGRAQKAGLEAQKAYAQSSRPRIIVRPRRLGPNAKRYCRSRLVQEFRVSGTVIVPHTTCWWQ
jgi:hypothetical protein